MVLDLEQGGQEACTGGAGSSGRSVFHWSRVSIKDTVGRRHTSPDYTREDPMPPVVLMKRAGTGSWAASTLQDCLIRRPEGIWIVPTLATPHLGTCD